MCGSKSYLFLFRHTLDKRHKTYFTQMKASTLPLLLYKFNGQKLSHTHIALHAADIMHVTLHQQEQHNIETI